ncbi:MAG TPA: beta-glucosidase [Acidobacteriaceae bacterium]
MSRSGWFVAVIVAVLVTGSVSLKAQAPIPDSPAVEQRVDVMLARMSTADKIKLIGGTDTFYTQALTSIGLPRFKMSDGPVGVRTWGPSTAYPAGIALAATWDTELALREGEALGDDARARGVNFLLGPGVDIYRSPLNGRNMEYFGEDPWLAGRMAVGYIRGVQSKGVSATVKHYDANNSEFDRHRSDSIIDERTLHEIYLPVFEAAVKDGDVGAVMDSYNLVNGEHATQNHTLNVDILKKDWGFQGVLMSDWGATYDGVAAANGGLDLEMPSAAFMNAQTLLPALKSGAVSEATLDDKVRRILRTAVRFGWLDRDQADLSIPLLSQASSKVALEAAEESVTLLKNDGHVLPLNANRQHVFVVLGPNAAPSIVGGGGSSHVQPFFSDSILTGISDLVGDRGKVYYVAGLPTAEHLFAGMQFASGTISVFNGDSVDGKPVRTGTAGKLNGWRENNNYGNEPQRGANDQGHTYLWRMSFVPATTGKYVLAVAEGSRDKSTVKLNGVVALQQEAHDGPATPAHASVELEQNKAVEIEVRYFTQATAPHLGLGLVAVDALMTPAEKKLVRSADAAIVAVGMNATYESEGFDRPFELPWGQDELVEATASLNPRTVVDVQAGGAVDAHAWIDRVPVLIDSWYGGQWTGKALAQVLFGLSPEGKLPMSWERLASDNPTYEHYYEEPGPERTIPYSEGLFYGYRYYTSMHKQPLFPFGFGLSYTTFAISNLKLTPGSGDKRLTVEFDVRNTGSVKGAEVAQVYVGDPSAKVRRPVKELKAFARVSLAPGASRHVALMLNDRSFSYYDVATHGWKMDPGRFDITVGNSSADDRLTGHVNLAP